MKQQITDFVQQDLLGNLQQISTDQDLLISGLVDSMGVMRLVAFIEQKIDRSIPPEDVTLENFASIDAISTYIQRYN